MFLDELKESSNYYILKNIECQNENQIRIKGPQYQMNKNEIIQIQGMEYKEMTKQLLNECALGYAHSFEGQSHRY